MRANKSRVDDARPPARADDALPWPRVAAAFALYLLAAAFSLALGPPAPALSSVWLADAVLLGLVLRTARRHSWLLLSAGAAAAALALTLFGRSASTTVLLTAAHMMTIAIAAAATRYVGLPRRDEISVRSGVRLWLCCAVIGPAASAPFAAAGLALIAGENFLRAASGWWTAQWAAMTLLLPLALLAERSRWAEARADGARIETIAYAALAALGTWAALRFSPFPFVLIVVPVLAAAIRTSLLGAALAAGSALLSFSVLAFGLEVGAEPLRADPAWSMFSLVLATAPAMLTAILFAQSRREREAIARSEALVRGAMDYSPSGFALLDLAQQWVKVNDALCDLSGYARADLMRVSFAALLHPEAHERYHAQMKGLRSGGVDAFQYALRIRRRDGAHVPVLLAMSVVRGEDGKPVFFVAQAVDISANYAAQARHRRAATQLTRVLEGSDDGFWDWKLVRGDVTFSARWAQMVGRDVRELPTRIETWLGLIHPEDLARFAHAHDDHVAGRSERMNIEYRIQHKDGHWIWVQCRGSAYVRARDGTPLRMAGTHRDINARRQVEQMKAELISTVSHELRTPLTSIRGALDLVLDGTTGELGADAQLMLTIAQRNCERLVLLVADIVDMESLDSGRLRVRRMAVDLAAVVREAVTANAGYGADRGIQLRADAPASASVVGDADRLMQVLANLLSNAIKFSPAGGTVEVTLAERGNHWRVTVRDHGEGVPEPFRARLFERFSQANASNTRTQGGSGLGLSIARGLAEAMGGEIGFEAPADGGASFWFALPRSELVAGPDISL